MPAAPSEPTDVCAGCGSVLVSMAGSRPAHAGASASCTQLFETTLRGLREEASSDASARAVVALADAAYDAQHPAPGAPVDETLARLARGLGAAASAPAGAPPRAWTTTIADVAADLDVIDLPALVEAWARSVHRDWCGAATRV